MEGLARVSKNAGRRPRLASVAFDGRYMGLALCQGGTARPQAARLHVVVCIFEGGLGRTIGALRAERHTLTSAKWTSCSACHELLCLRTFLFIVLRSAQHPQIPRFLQFFRGIWPMPLSLLNHSALALFAQRTRIPTSACSIGFCAIWVCISSSSSSANWVF